MAKGLLMLRIISIQAYGFMKGALAARSAVSDKLSWSFGYAVCFSQVRFDGFPS
jgi:hypothetical protein